MTDKSNQKILSEEKGLEYLKKELEFRDRQLDLIKEVAQDIITELDFNKLINSVALKAQTLIEAESLVVPIINKERTHYTYKAACGKNAALILNQSFPVSVGMCGWVLTNEKPLFFSEENEWLMDEKTSWEDGMESALLVPLISRGEIVGGLSGLGKKDRGGFTRQDYELLLLFASHISVALDNARIFKELSDEKEYVETTLNSIGDGVITTDAKGCVHKINPVASNLLALEEADIKGQLLSDVFEIINSSSRKPVNNPVNEVLRTGEISDLASHTVLIAKDGSEYQIADSAAPIKDAEGNIQGVILVFRDVTEEYVLQTALKENQQQLQSILDNTPAVIYVKDIEGRYLLINRQFEHLFRITNERIYGLTDHDIFPEELADAFRKNDLQVAKTRRALEIEEKAPHDDGLHTYISVKFPLYDKDNVVNGVCGISTDITEHLQIEKALQRSQKMKAIGQLSGGIAHDFNNQLGIVVGYLDMLKKPLEYDEKMSRWLETSDRAAQRCIELTRQLLSFSRNQAVEKNNIDINTSITEMKNMIARSITPEVDVNYQLQENLWEVLLNKGELQDAVLNVVINARDAMPAGGNLLIETHNVVLDEGQILAMPDISPGNYIELAITDTGTGMDKQIQERVFEPFFTTKEEGTGTGLGMSMVYGFVKRYKGQIKIYSEQGVGTTMRIYLPRYDENEDGTNINKALINSKAELPVGTETILIVDDEEDLLQLADQYLRDQGYQTITAKNAKDALEIFKENLNIDMIFSDVVMPGDKNGFDLIDEALSIRPGAKYLLTSGFTSKANKKHGSSPLAKSLLSKPYRKDSLVQRIRKVLDQ